jgi:hypothetical protein
MKPNDIVAVSTMNGTKFGRVMTKDKKRATINVGGNVITAEIRHITKVQEKKLLNKLNKTL